MTSKPGYFVGEPIVVHLTLKLETPPTRDSTGRVSSGTEKRRVIRQFDALLRNNDGEVIARAMLGAGGFAINEEDSAGVHAILMGVFGNLDVAQGGGASFQLWKESGRYNVVLLDIDTGIRSNPQEITLYDAPDGEEKVVDLLESAGIDLPWAYLGMPNTDQGSKAMHQIVYNYSGSVYAKYAKAALAIASMRVRKPANENVTRANGQLTDLRDALDSIAMGHPLRSQGLLIVAEAEARSGFTERALNTLTILLEETTDASVRERTTALIQKAGNRLQSPAGTGEKGPRTR